MTGSLPVGSESEVASRCRRSPPGCFRVLAHSPTFAVRDFAGSVSFDDGTIKGMRLEIVVNAAALQLVDKVSAADRGEIEGRMRRRSAGNGDLSGDHASTLASSRCETIGAATIACASTARCRCMASPATFSVDAELSIFDDGIRLRGEFPLRLSDYRIKPVTALGGAIKLKDELKLSFDLVGLPEGS